MWPFSSNMPRGEKVVLTISGLHCTSCVLNIDGALEDMKGVYSSKTSYAKSKTEVEYDPQVVSLKDLRKAIEEQGYGVE